MKLNTLFVSFLLVACQLSFGQDTSGLKKRQPKKLSESSVAVTRAEAVRTFERVGELLQSVLHVTSPKHFSLKSDAVAVTRSEVLEQFGVLYHAAEPAFRVTMHDANFDPKRIKIDRPEQKKLVDLLLVRGCVEPYCSLVTGRSKPLSVAEFGDFVGFFVARITEMSHTSSTKWTPYLRAGQ